MDKCLQRSLEFQQGSGIKTITGNKVEEIFSDRNYKLKCPTFKKKGMATTSRPIGSTRSLASGVGCGAVIVVCTAQTIDRENGILRRDMTDAFERRLESKLGDPCNCILHKNLYEIYLKCRIYNAHRYVEA